MSNPNDHPRATGDKSAPADDSAAAAELLARLAPDVFYAADQDMWVRLEADGLARVGATHVVAGHGQFMLFTPRPQGTEVTRDQSLGVMETAKTAVAIHAPLSGRLLEANAMAVADVDLVTRDPYGAGWLFLLQPSAWASERAALMSASDYARWLAPRLAQKTAGPLDDDALPDVDPLSGY